MHQWQLPPLPLRFSRSSTNSAQARLTLAELGMRTRSGLSTAKSTRTRAAMEISLIDWLYDSIRRSIKRGRLFEIDRVLSEGEADCLGYAQLLQKLVKDFKEKVFQPFFSTKEEGTGLGLSIAARIIQDHKGCLNLRSREGKGATFIITLPCRGDVAWLRY